MRRRIYQYRPSRCDGRNVVAERRTESFLVEAMQASPHKEIPLAPKR
jgi:hypothetical protein